MIILLMVKFIQKFRETHQEIIHTSVATLSDNKKFFKISIRDRRTFCSYPTKFAKTTALRLSHPVEKTFYLAAFRVNANQRVNILAGGINKDSQISRRK